MASGVRANPSRLQAAPAGTPATALLLVFSQILGETIFLREDEHTKTALIEAGADEWSIYTCEELRLLIEQHRRKPITAAELLQIHRARRIFNARIGG